MTEKMVIRIADKDSAELARVAEKLTSEAEGELIRFANWKEYPYIPETKFWIGYSSRELFLHYSVLEQGPIARFDKINDPVCLDSCVEFFVSPGEGPYFNFEFNATGTPYAAYGHDRNSSTPLSPQQVRSIRRRALPATAFHNATYEVPWSLTVGIPLAFFAGTALKNPSGQTFSANFYKCAEQTATPHFVTWSPVTTESPDFHRPEFFGAITFL